jgi:hypothetical protein
VYRTSNYGLQRINTVPIPCVRCSDGLGATYQFTVPKHKGGVQYYVELMLGCFGCEHSFHGPAVRIN